MYEILKEITPDVKLAISDNKLFILKRIFPDDAEVYRKLMEISNENIAAISGITVIEGMTFAVREYVQGISLEEYTEKNKPISEEETKRIILGICNGLSAVHSLGIVHRDITPANIIISDDNVIKIIDFGISRTIKENKTKDTHILGTAGYAAPEQFGFSQTGIRADIFAVGVLMNYMLTGCMPNEKYADGILGDIVRKATQIDENNRYKTVEELANSIREINPISQLLRSYVPGFRQGKASHKIGAVIFYVIFIAGFFTGFSHENGIRKYAADCVVWIFMAGIPFLIATDFLRWTEKTEFVRALSKKKKIILKCVLIFLSLIISSLFII